MLRKGCQYSIVTSHNIKLRAWSLKMGKGGHQQVDRKISNSEIPDLLRILSLRSGPIRWFCGFWPLEWTYCCYLRYDLLINDKLCGFSMLHYQRRMLQKISIFNFLAFVPVYKISLIVLLLFCKFNFLMLLPSSYLTSLSSVDIHPNNRDFMAPWETS